MAPMVINAELTAPQERALAASAVGLPDRWRVVVSADEVEGTFAFEVRIVGPTFVAVAAFRTEAHPIELAHFLERTKDEHA